MESTFYRRTFAVVVAAVLAYAVWRIVEPFLSPILWATFLTFLAWPLHVRLQQRLQGRRSLSAALLTLAMPIVILGPLVALATTFTAQAAPLIGHLRALAGRLGGTTLSDVKTHPIVARALAWLDDTLGIQWDEIVGWLAAGGETAIRKMASIGGGFVAGTMGTVTAFFLMIMLIFFFLRDGDRILARAARLIPMAPADREQLFAHLGKVTRAVVTSSFVTAIAQGALVGIGFALAGVGAPVVFGVLAAFLALLPLVGPPIVWIPAAIWLAANGRWGAAIFLTVWGVGVSWVDNLLRPVLVSRQVQVSELTVFIGVLGGAVAFGAIGLVAGPLVLTLLAALANYAETRLSREGAR
jgi:predicted PurR-regulated permease PerM